MASATDVITLESAKESLQIADTDLSSDDRLAAYITGVSERLDSLCGPIVRRTVTEYLDGTGRPWIRTTKTPIHSVSEIIEYRSGSPTALTAETATGSGDYTLSLWRDGLYTNRIIRRSGWTHWTWEPGVGNVKVTYSAGRYANTAGVAGTRFELAARIMLRILWMSEETGTLVQNEFEVPMVSFPRFGVPNAVKEILAGQMLGKAMAVR
jgi:hypothetical protein